MSELLVDKVTFGANGSQVQPGFTGFRNKIINGCFRLWQRGFTQTAVVGYGSDDRWYNNNTGSTKSISIQTFPFGQTDVPTVSKHFSRYVVTSVAGADNFAVKQQRLEFIRNYSDKTVTLSFWAKADAVRNMSVDLAQNFGTGGSPSAAVTGIGATKFTLGTSWQRYTLTANLPSIFGKTEGSDDNSFLELTFWFDAGSTFNSRTDTLGQQSGTFDLSSVQLEEGYVATPFEDRQYGIEFNLCRRYFENHGLNIMGFSAAANNAIGITHSFYPKRKVPTFTRYSQTEASNAQAPFEFQYTTSMTARVLVRGAAQGQVVYSGIYWIDAEL